MENCVPIPAWNNKNIVQPEIFSKKLLDKGAVSTSSRLHKIFSNIVVALGKSSLLFQEAAVLSRLIFRNKSTLRRDKGLKILQMLNQTMKRFLRLRALDVFTSLKNCTFEDRCPTRQSVQWGLLTLQRLVSLFTRAHSLAIFAAQTIRQRLSTGHLLRFGTLGLATVSRIWVLTENFLIHGCEWYSIVKRYEDTSPDSGQTFLPESLTLPQNLDHFLPKFSTSNSAENSDESVLQPGSSSEMNRMESEVECSLPYFNEDLGEAIPRKPPKKKRK